MMYRIADALSVSVINLVLSKEEIDRFYYDEEIGLRYPGSDKLKEILNKVLENNTAWVKAKHVAIVNLDEIDKL